MHWSRSFREWSRSWGFDPPPAAFACYALAAPVVLVMIGLLHLLDVRE
jgi:hypothetical protein